MYIHARKLHGGPKIWPPFVVKNSQRSQKTSRSFLYPSRGVAREVLELFQTVDGGSWLSDLSNGAIRYVGRHPEQLIAIAPVAIDGGSWLFFGRIVAQ